MNEREEHRGDNREQGWLVLNINKKRPMTRRPWIFVNKERADDGLKGQSQQAPAFKNVMDVIRGSENILFYNVISIMLPVSISFTHQRRLFVL